MVDQSKIFSLATLAGRIPTQLKQLDWVYAGSVPLSANRRFSTINRVIVMRNICLLALLLSSGTAFAQQGTIRYKSVERTDISLEDILSADAMEVLDSATVEAVKAELSERGGGSGWIVWYDGQSVLSKMVVPERPQDEFLPGWGGPPTTIPFIGLGTSGQDAMESKVFFDYENGVAAVSFPSGMTEPYVIIVDMHEINEIMNWVIGDRDSTIMGYAVRHARINNDNISAEAWFAPDLGTPAGPMNIGGLPGAILLLNAEMLLGGRMTHSSYLVDSISSELSRPVVPPDGVEISFENLQALMQHRLEMMRTMDVREEEW